jgi:hypothetical protein
MQLVFWNNTVLAWLTALGIALAVTLRDPARRHRRRSAMRPAAGTWTCTPEDSSTETADEPGRATSAAALGFGEL